MESLLARSRSPAGCAPPRRHSRGEAAAGCRKRTGTRADGRVGSSIFGNADESMNAESPNETSAYALENEQTR
eukprot:1125897-Pleurochrysis_carterae.AAC.2